MKRVIAGIVTLGLVLSFGQSSTVFAHGHHRNHNNSYTCGYCSKNCSYVDRDNDGYCDNCDRAICQKTHRSHNGRGGHCGR